MVDLGLLVVRVVVGALLAAHGLQKLTGWFGGPGVAGHTDTLASLGYRRPRELAWLHGLSETAAGVLLVLGLLTPLASAATIAVMLNAAVAVHAPNGLWVQQGGYEYPLVLAAVAAGLALTGPGAIAIDTWAGWELTGTWAVGGIALGVLAGLLALVARRAPRQGEAPDGRPGIKVAA